MMHLEARMQHEEESFPRAVERLTELQRVREEGPEYLTKESHGDREQQHQNTFKNDVTIFQH